MKAVAVFCAAIAMLVLSVVLMELIFKLFEIKANEALRLITAQLIGYLLWFGTLVLLLRTRYRSPFWESLAWFRPKQGFWRAASQGPMLAFAVASFVPSGVSTPWLRALLRKSTLAGSMTNEVNGSRLWSVRNSMAF